MDQPKTPAYALIVDQDLDFLASINPSPEVPNMLPLTAETSIKAMGILKDPSHKLCAMFVNHALPIDSWLDVLRVCHAERAGIPIFHIQSDTDPLSDIYAKDDLPNLGILESRTKPLTFQDMAAMVAPYWDESVEAEAIREHSTSRFVAIRPQNFLTGSNSIFDVYVRMAGEKFVRICQEGMLFDEERVRNYIDKGINFFYIRKDAQENYVKYCEQLTLRILKSEKVPDHVKVIQAMKFGEETMAFIQTMNVGEKELRAAVSYANVIQDAFNQFKPKSDSVLNAFLKDLAGYDHGVGTAMIASMLAKPLAIESKAGLEVLGTAALLHDIGLVGMPADVQTEDESIMSAKQKALYQKHPEIGRDAVRNLPGINMTVVQAIAHHHIRRNQSGFPPEIDYNSLTLIAKIVGISSEFSRIISQAKANPKINAMKKMEQEIFPGFSQDIVKAFQSVFKKG